MIEVIFFFGVLVVKIVVMMKKIVILKIDIFYVELLKKDFFFRFSSDDWICDLLLEDDGLFLVSVVDFFIDVCIEDLLIELYDKEKEDVLW